MPRSCPAYSAPNTPPRFTPGDRVIVDGERAWIDGGPDVAGTIVTPDGWQDAERVLVKLDTPYPLPMVAHVVSVRPLTITCWQDLDTLPLSDAEKSAIWNDLYEWNGDDL